jgi:hypothetical protein
MRSSRVKSVVINSSVLVISLIVGFLIAEMVVRIWFPQPMLPRYVVDAPYGIRTNKPNMSIWHTSPDYRVNVRTNSKGIRSDREIPYEKPVGTFRIVGLGDSFTLGYEVDLEDTYLFQVESILHERGHPRVEVVNLAVSGFGTAEELITLNEEGFKYSPDVVVLGYFNNDMENNITSNLFAIKNGTLVRESMSYLPAVGIRKVLYAIPGYKLLAEESQLWNIFRNRISFMISQGLYAKNFEKEAKEFGGGDTLASKAAYAAARDYEVALTARLLDEIALQCVKRNVRFVLVSIPYAGLNQQMYSNLPIDRMKSLHDVIFIDAASVFAPFHGKQEIHWEKWHGHWRPWAHRLFAQTLADSIGKYIASSP